MLVDANLLLYAVDEESQFHARAAEWLTVALTGPTRVGLPWQSLVAFLRISTHPRASRQPLDPDQAWSQVETWLSVPSAWVPQATDRHAHVLGDLVTRYSLRGNLIPDAQLAALAIEHGLAVVSADTDFARFSEIRWENPLRGSPQPPRA